MSNQQVRLLKSCKKKVHPLSTLALNASFKTILTIWFLPVYGIRWLEPQMHNNTMQKQCVTARPYCFHRNQEGKLQPGAANQMHVINWSSANVSASIKAAFWSGAFRCLKTLIRLIRKRIKSFPTARVGCCYVWGRIRICRHCPRTFL